MPAITLFSTAFTDADQIAENVASITGYKVVDDGELIEATCKQYGIGKRELEKAVYHQPFIFNASDRKKASAIAALKLVLAEFLMQEPCIYFGYLGHLIPKKISLRVLVVAGMESRMQYIFRNKGELGKRALQQIRREDKSLYAWTRYLEEKEQCDIASYDVVIPSDKLDLDTSVRQVIEKLANKPDCSGDHIKAAVADFALAARVAFAVAQKGYDVSVAAASSRVTLTINKNVAMLFRLERKLKKIAAGVPGVREVETKVGKGFYRANICHRYDYQIPSARIRADYERKYAILYQSVAQQTSTLIQRAPWVQPKIEA